MTEQDHKTSGEALRPDIRQPWKTLTSSELHRQPHLKVDTVQLHGGGQLSYVYRPRGGQAALVVPITPEGNIVLLRQYRYPLGATLTEIVAGGVEPGETPLEAARRELREEVGGSATEWITLPSFCPQPSFTGQIFHPFIALDVQLGLSELEESELLTFEVVPLPEAYRQLEAGAIPNAPSALSLFHARAPLTRRGLL